MVVFSAADTEGCLDIILNIYINVTSGLVVYPKMIEKRIMGELPFMATENILMHCVKNGGDRQALHELIRDYSMMAGEQVKVYGKENNLIDLIKKDENFTISDSEIEKTLKPENFIGRSAEQVEEFIYDSIDPILKRHRKLIGYNADMKV